MIYIKALLILIPYCLLCDIALALRFLKVENPWHWFKRCEDSMVAWAMSGHTIEPEYQQKAYVPQEAPEPEYPQKAGMPPESKEKSPWGWGTLLIVSFFAGFAAGGIIAGINWRRMGKQGLMWPTIIGSIVVFILFVYFLPETVSNSTASFVSLAPVLGLWLWQKGYYRRWKESHPEAQRAGWQIPTATALGAIVVVVAIVLTPILMPDEATKLNNQGVELIEEGKFQQAVVAFDEAIDLDPQFAEAYYNRALCQSLLGNLSEALEDANKAIELTPNDAMSYWLRGLICVDLDKTEQAIADLERSLDLGLEPLQQTIAEMNLAELTTSK